MQMDLQAQSKKLLYFFLLSASLNIALIASFFSLYLQKSAPASSPSFTHKEELFSSNAELLHLYSSLSFKELLDLLYNKEKVEAGYTKRDLALAILVGFHGFNIEKALRGIELPKRQVLFSSSLQTHSLTLFPGLTEEDFQALLHYIHTEEWPWNSATLFTKMQHLHLSSLPIPTSLQETFFLTPEFVFLENFFLSSSLPLPRHLLLSLLLEGAWQNIQNAPQLSIEKFLYSYVEKDSSLAIKLLLHFYLPFVTRHLEDEAIISLLDRVKETPDVLLLCNTLLSTPRSDKVWKKASFIRSSLQENPAIQETEVSPSSLEQKETEKELLYRVQKGDSLWKIAHKHGVKIESIIEKNALPTIALKPGQTLTIPSSQKKSTN